MCLHECYERLGVFCGVLRVDVGVGVGGAKYDEHVAWAAAFELVDEPFGVTPLVDGGVGDPRAQVRHVDVLRQCVEVGPQAAGKRVTDEQERRVGG